MPSDQSLVALEAIGNNIRLARRFLAGMSRSQFASDERTQYAVIRCLEIVSEASRRVSVETKARHPEVPWPQIAGAGNVYRHDYEDILPQLLWTTVQDHLHLLERAVATELDEQK